MPEASIHKDRYASTCEHEIGPHYPTTDANGEIFAISEAEPVKGDSQRHFGFRVRSPDRSHVA